MGKVKWTYEACKEEALKYESRAIFQKCNGSVYNRAFKQGWLDDICSHMVLLHKPNGYWTYDRCKKEFEKYTNCSDLRKNNDSCACAAIRNKWYQELSTHFIKKGHKYKRFIYACEFIDNSVYIGLTYNTSERFNKHQKTGSVYNHILKTESIPTFRILTEEPVEVDKAVKLEQHYLLKYKEKGWFILNVAKTGSIGGNNLIWTFEAVKNEALKYKTKTEFEKNNPSAYTTALKKKWIDEVCGHMIALKKPANFWKDFDNCKEEALKYHKISDFRSKGSAAFKSAQKNNWLSDICGHMVELKKPNGYYTLEVCIELSKNCKTRKEYKEKYSTAYSKVFKNKWVDIVFKDLK